jgi:hypothetical protein
MVTLLMSRICLLMVCAYILLGTCSWVNTRTHTYTRARKRLRPGFCAYLTTHSLEVKSF